MSLSKKEREERTVASHDPRYLEHIASCQKLMSECRRIEMYLASESKEIPEGLGFIGAEITRQIHWAEMNPHHVVAALNESASGAAR